MNISKVREIREEYKKKAIDENYMNGNTNDILWTCNRVMEYDQLIGTTLDKLTFGEYTRRFERWMEELETLMEG
jgi:tRNA U34 2-thiouridine synthase MnmA/TrmU